jgi:peptidyl-dipeptidase A
VKKKLSENYSDRIDLNKGALPAHLLGDLWGQQWHNIFEDVKPFKNKPLLDITESMLAKVFETFDFRSFN